MKNLKITKIVPFILLVLLIFSTNSQLFAQADGSRAYWPVPKATTIATPLYFNINSNQVLLANNYINADADFNTNLYGIMLTQSFELKGRTAAVIGFFSGGNTEGGYNDFQGKASGLADFYGMGILNLVGAPAVNVEEYMKTKYDFILDLQLAFRAPIGQYDAEKAINIGTNRWELKLGAPMIKFLNWGTSKVTSFEVLPSVSFYTNNNDITDGDTLKRKPTFNLESHITQAINQMLWVSLDSYYVTGGATAIDNANFNERLSTFQLGGTLGVYLSTKLNFKFTYGGSVAHNKYGMDGNMLRITGNYIF
ncbi:transporter [Lutibacter holmesii]|uniref:Transporter n=1 Tax=Lutibacter holmesii TaxID=1137985 RepID=A0ABW3WJY0_9FLAO